jgi:hypothetical protein
MRFKSPIWQPISIVLSAINLVAVGFAAGAAEPWHAATHSALALGFGLWAQRLLQRRRPLALEGELERDDRLEMLEGEMHRMREELTEAQERLDFAERVLAKAPETRRLGPDA